MANDMNISGSGSVGSGEYNNVSVSGSARVGDIRCVNFTASGAANCGKVECEQRFTASGSCGAAEIKAGTLHASGSLRCGGDMTVDDEVKVSGSTHCGNLKCGRLKGSGSTDVDNDIEAENIYVTGKIECGGLMNAEEITIRFSNNMEIGSIGGSKIEIVKDDIKNRIKIPFLSAILQPANATVTVHNSIEGDEITVDNLKTPRVSGRIVKIGKSCEIDLVQYAESVEIDPEAKVGNTEKIG